MNIYRRHTHTHTHFEVSDTLRCHTHLFRCPHSGKLHLSGCHTYSFRENVHCSAVRHSSFRSSVGHCSHSVVECTPRKAGHTRSSVTPCTQDCCAVIRCAHWTASMPIHRLLTSPQMSHSSKFVIYTHAYLLPTCIADHLHAQGESGEDLPY